MTNDKNSKSSITSFLIGTFFSLAAIFLIAQFVNIEEAKSTLINADFRNLPWVIVCFFGTMFARAMSWKTVLNHRISFSKSFWTLNQGYILNNFLPFRLGEIGRAVSLNITEKIPFLQGISSILVDRIFDITILGALLLISFPSAVGMQWQSYTPWWIFFLLAFLIVGLYFVAHFPNKVIRIVNKIFSKNHPLFKSIAEKVNSVITELSVIGNKGVFLQVTGWMSLAWLFNIGWYIFLLTAFLDNVTFLNATFIMGVASLGVAIPSTPGYIGIFEGTVASAFTFLSINPEIGLAFAIAAHLVYFIITSTLGAFALAKDGVSIFEMYQKIKSTKN